MAPDSIGKIPQDTEGIVSGKGHCVQEESLRCGEREATFSLPMTAVGRGYR